MKLIQYRHITRLFLSKTKSHDLTLLYVGVWGTTCDHALKNNGT